MDRWCTQGAVVRAVVSNVFITEWVTPQLLTCLLIEGCKEVVLTFGEHRDGLSLGHRDIGIAGSECLLPGDRQTERIIWEGLC